MGIWLEQWLGEMVDRMVDGVNAGWMVDGGLSGRVLDIVVIPKVQNKSSKVLFMN